MADSLVRHNPTYNVIIGLFDKINDRDVSLLKDYQIIEIGGEQIPDFEQLFSRYTPFELSCLAKPYLAGYLLKTFPEVQKLLYFDSDMLIFSPLTPIEQDLEQHNIVITPHVTQPISDEQAPRLRHFLNAGMYNGGFFAVRRGEEAQHFLTWWQGRVWHEGYFNFPEGMFVDQLWLNYVPIFYPKALISRHLGYNMAYWNLHERTLTQEGAYYKVNRIFPLVFFHFSGYKFSEPQQISIHQTRHSFKTRPDLKSVFETYHQAVVSNNDAYFRSQPCVHDHPTYFFQKSRGLRRKLIEGCYRLLRMLKV
ncbi:MAG: glycosyl transferase [Runella sp.]